MHTINGRKAVILDFVPHILFAPTGPRQRPNKIELASEATAGSHKQLQTAGGQQLQQSAATKFGLHAAPRSQNRRLGHCMQSKCWQQTAIMNYPQSAAVELFYIQGLLTCQAVLFGMLPMKTSTQLLGFPSGLPLMIQCCT